MHFTKLRSTGMLFFLGCLFISGACGTAFPPGALDWGHGAKPLAKGDGRTQAGGGAGALLGARVSPSPMLALGGVGGGGGVSAELQATDSLLLRADAALGLELSGLGLGATGAGYVGAQLNLLPNLAARARLGAGASVTLSPVPSPYLGGEAGLVWSFLSSEQWEGWVYGYGVGRAGVSLIITDMDPNFPVPSESEWVNNRLLGAGASVGFAFTDSSGVSWYISGRTDVPIFRVSAPSAIDGENVFIPTIGAQGGFTYRF